VLIETVALPACLSPTIRHTRLAPRPELLRHADEQLAAGQLTEPAGDNAWESYQQVLVLEPENTAAQAGLQRLLGQAKQILNEKIKALNHTEQEVEVEEQAIRLSIQRTLAQEWEQYSKQAASHQ
jgi:hypothetical protein